MLILLVPVTLIEGLVLARRHLLKYPESFRLSLRANLRSTLVGLPLGYVFAILGLVPAGLFSMLLPKKVESTIATILGSAIVHGGKTPTELNEIGFFLGTLIVMIPYFLVTLNIERNVIVRLKPDLDTPELTKTVRIMNGITYGLLAIPVVVGAVMAVMKLGGVPVHRSDEQFKPLKASADGRFIGKGVCKPLVAPKLFDAAQKRLTTFVLKGDGGRGLMAIPYRESSFAITMGSQCIAAPLAAAVVLAAEVTKHSVKPKDGFVPDAETAIKIAVAVWEPIYSEHKIAGEKPYRARVDMKRVRKAEGSQPKGWLGGVAIAEIAKNDGRIVRVSHGK
jgi:hypothetical protein